MSPKMRKVSIAAGIALVVLIGWWYFRMPGPSIAGLTRPQLVLMDAAGATAAAKPGGVQPRAPLGQRNPAQAGRPAWNSNRRPPVRPPVRRPVTRPGAGNPATGSSTVDLPAVGNLQNPAFDRSEWRRKRREMIEQRRRQMGIGGQPIEPIDNGQAGAPAAGAGPEIAPDETAQPAPEEPPQPPPAEPPPLVEGGSGAAPAQGGGGIE